MVALVVSIVVSSKKITWTECTRGPFCAEFACYHHVCMDSLLLQLRPTVYRLVGLD